ncbi:MAG: GntR family transcriptional regulator [Kiloniellaceae bacterium]
MTTTEIQGGAQRSEHTGRRRDKPATRAEKIAVELEAEIVRGDLLPGQRLDELAISKRFKVSRTPVREALRALAASGLVAHEPRIGAIVARPTVGEIVELFELVGELEAVAARLACERMTEVSRARISQTYEACRDAALSGDANEYLAKNDEFHKAIQESAENNALSAQIDALNNRLAPYRRFITFQRERKETAEREHEVLAEALLAGDGDAAAKAMRDHVKVLAADAMNMALSLRL